LQFDIFQQIIHPNVEYTERDYKISSYTLGTITVTIDNDWYAESLQISKRGCIWSKNMPSHHIKVPTSVSLYFIRQRIDVLGWIENAFPRVILLGHLKSTMIEKDGKEVSAKDLDLGGKLKSMTSADVDCIGLLYRNKNNECMISFKTTDDIICGARPQHLKNQEFVISEITPEGEFKTFWNKIFID